MNIYKHFVFIAACIIFAGCSTLSDNARRASKYDGLKGAAGYLAKYPNEKEVEVEVRRTLNDFAKKQGLSSDEFVKQEYRQYLKSLGSSTNTLSSFLFYLEGLDLIYARGMVSEQTYILLKSDFKTHLVGNFVSGRFDGLMQDSRVKTFFPELLSVESLKALTSKSIAEIGTRERREFQYNVEFLMLADNYSTPAGVVAVKRFLAGYAVSAGELLILDETKSFKVDRSKLPQPKSLGDFHILELSKFSPEIRNQLRTLVKDFKDPDNVKFRDVTALESLSKIHICGEVNGVNSYGAFVGFKKFVTSALGKKIQDESSMPYSDDVNLDCSPSKFRLDQFEPKEVAT